MYRTLTIAALSAILLKAEDDDHDHDHDHDHAHEEPPEFELLVQFTGIADDGRTTESCAFDPVNDEWVFFDQQMGQIDTLSGSYPIDLSAADFTEGMNTTTATIGTLFVAGSENLIYIAKMDDSTIATYNVDTGVFTPNIIDITNDVGFGTNAFCYDAERDTLYTTSVGLDFDVWPFERVPGAAGIWRIESPESDDPTITRINVTNVPTQDGGIYSYQPNGCEVANDKVWFVETRFDLSGALGIYDIEADTFTVNTDILKDMGDGIILIENYLVMSGWGSWDGTDKAGFLSWYDLDEYPEGNFTVGIDGFIGSADIAYQSSTNIICVPSLTEGTVEFVQMTIHEETTEAPGDNANNMSAVIRLIATCISYILLN